MTDAEHLSGHIAEARAEGHAIGCLGMGHDAICVKTLRHADGRHGVRIQLRTRCADLKTPGPDGGAHAGCDTMMAGKDVFQAFLQQHAARLIEAVQHPVGRRIGIAACGCGRRHVLQVEIAAGQPALLCRFHRFGRKRHDAEARREHEAFLRASDGDIHAPVVKAEIHAGDGADTIHEQERRVRSCIERFAHIGHVGRHAGCGFVMCDQNRLDRVLGVSGQLRLGPVGRKAFAPGHFGHHNVEAKVATHFDPLVAEHAIADGQNRVARNERVGQCRFPAACTGGREDEDLCMARFDDGLDACSRGGQQCRERRRAVIDCRQIAGPAQMLGHVGRTGDENRILKTHALSPPNVGPLLRSQNVFHNFFEIVFHNW